MIKLKPIQHDIYELLPAVAAYMKCRKDVLFAYLFGSLARGNFSAMSDVDIAVYLKKRNISEKRLQIIGDLADILKTDEIATELQVKYESHH